MNDLITSDAHDSLERAQAAVSLLLDECQTLYPRQFTKGLARAWEPKWRHALIGDRRVPKFQAHQIAEGFAEYVTTSAMRPPAPADVVKAIEALRAERDDLPETPKQIPPPAEPNCPICLDTGRLTFMAITSADNPLGGPWRPDFRQCPHEIDPSWQVVERNSNGRAISWVMDGEFVNCGEFWRRRHLAVRSMRQTAEGCPHCEGRGYLRLKWPHEAAVRDIQCRHTPEHAAAAEILHGEPWPKVATSLKSAFAKMPAGLAPSAQT